MKQGTLDEILPQMKKPKIQNFKVEAPKSREDLIARISKLKDNGWMQTRQQVNDGLVGNTLEDYLGIKENNLQLPDAGIYELKAQRIKTCSLTTLFHLDPHPRKPQSVVTNYLGPIYGWEHKRLKQEWSFRITMYGNQFTNRGFKIAIDEQQQRLIVEFDAKQVTSENQEWLLKVLRKGGQKLEPQPYWYLKELREKAMKKITNIIYIQAETRKKGKFEEFRYTKAIIYEGFDFNKFKDGVLNGKVFIDFDARTGHNHGTKFRMRQGSWSNFFSFEERLF